MQSEIVICRLSSAPRTPTDGDPTASYVQLDAGTKMYTCLIHVDDERGVYLLRRTKEQKISPWAKHSIALRFAYPRISILFPAVLLIPCTLFSSIVAAIRIAISKP